MKHTVFVTFVDTYNVKFARDCLCLENLLMSGNIILLHGWLEGVDELLKCLVLFGCQYARLDPKIKSRETKAWFKRRILHAPNTIVELCACKMRRLKQLYSTYLN